MLPDGLVILTSKGSLLAVNSGATATTVVELVNETDEALNSVPSFPINFTVAPETKPVPVKVILLPPPVFSDGVIPKGATLDIDIAFSIATNSELFLISKLSVVVLYLN